MRRQWEERDDELDLDAPATVTERDLRSLRRRAGFGVFAVLLSIISIAGLAWTLYAGPEGLEQVQGVKERLLNKGTEPEATASVTPPPPAPDSLAAPQPLAADSATATPEAATPSGPTPSGPESRRVSTQGSAAGN